MNTRSTAASVIRVYSGGAPQHVLGVLLPMFERSCGRSVIATYEIVGRIRERLVSGERPDLILLPDELLTEVGRVVQLGAEGRCVLGRIGIGVIVGAAAGLPDLSDEYCVRSMLRGARAIALADVRTPTGRFLDQLLQRLGLAEELQGRLIRTGAIHGGGELVALGEADVGLYLLSEVQHINGVRVAGLLPPPLQHYVVYATAIPASDRSSAAAMSLVRFLTAPEHAGRWREGGFEPAQDGRAR